MRKFLVLSVVGCVLASADTALAVGDGDLDPIVTTVQASLTVSPAGGTITGQIVGDSGQVINCGSDCTEDLDYTQTCDPPPGPQLCSDNHVTVRLTASRPGFTANWNDGDCDSEPSVNVCEVEVTTQGQTVGLTWIDSAAPTVGFSSPAPIAGPATTFTAIAGDNVAVAKVDFYVDDVLRGTDTSPSYQFAPNLSLYTDGSTHTLKAISQDASGNRSSSLASAPSHSFTVDKSTGVSSVSTPASLVNAAPSVMFTPPGDLKANGMTCTTKRGTTTTGSTTGCTPPYTAQLGASPPDGSYTVELRAEDSVGNVATVTRTFTYDATDPQVQITGGPAEGAVIDSRSASYNFAASDANGVTITCRLDNGAFGPCSGADSHALSALSLGGHTFTVRAVDGAGNESSAQRTFTVQDPPTQTPDQGTQGGGSTTTTTTATTTTTTGANTTGAPGNQGESSDPPVVAARSSAKFSVKRGKTKVAKLALTGLARGTVVEVTCKGKGCPRGTTKFTVKKTKLVLTSVFKKRTLGAGAKIEVRVTQPGRRGKLFRYATQKGSKKPKSETTVLAT